MSKKKISTNSAEAIVAGLNKSLGSGTIVPLGETDVENVERIPTGILALDEILGGGFAKGKMVEIAGKEGSGKSSCAMQFIGQAQKHGKCVLIDLESAYDPRVAENSGVDTEALLYAQPNSAEETLDVIEQLLGADDVSAIVIDSVEGMTPQAEINGDFTDSHVAVRARLMALGLRKLGVGMKDSDVIIVWINQMRDLINSMGFGPKSTTPGGRALKFWCSTRLDLSRVKNITASASEGSNVIGHTVRVKTIKSRFAPPFQQAEFDILYDTGISNESTLLDMALDAGLIEKSGSWFTDTTSGESLGQGKLNVVTKLYEDPDAYERLLAAVRGE